MSRFMCLGLPYVFLALAQPSLADPPPTATAGQPPVREEVILPSVTVPSSDRVPPSVTVPSGDVVMAPALAREVVDYGDFIGRAEAAHSVDIRPRVSGQLDKICFKAGSTVQKGDLLFEIDPRRCQAELDKRMAELQVAEARLKRSAVDLQRVKKLVANNSVSQEIVERAEAELCEAEAAVKTAQAGLEIAKLQLDFTKVRAPIGGKIGLPTLDAGNLVTADTTLLASIVATNPLYVIFDVDERTILQVGRRARGNPGKVGDKPVLPVTCALTDEIGYPRQGTLDATENHIEPATGTLRVRALLPGSDGLIVPGMFIRVRLTLSEPHKAVVIPERAVLTNQGSKQVFVVTANNTVERRNVKLGSVTDGMRVVKEGLVAGENVVVAGAQRLRPGMKIKVTKKAESPGR
jgi:RND family efflux transporter MFP subunit